MQVTTIKSKTLKIGEKTHQALLKYCSEKQIEIGRHVSFEEGIQSLLQSGTLTVKLPTYLVEKLTKETQRIYGTSTLEEGLKRIFEEWVEKKKAERTKK